MTLFLQVNKNKKRKRF